jgi:hypothetical protein
VHNLFAGVPKAGSVAVCGMPALAKWAGDRHGESGLLVTASVTSALGCESAGWDPITLVDGFCRLSPVFVRGYRDLDEVGLILGRRSSRFALAPSRESVDHTSKEAKVESALDFRHIGPRSRQGTAPQST